MASEQPPFRSRALTNTHAAKVVAGAPVPNSLLAVLGCRFLLALFLFLFDSSIAIFRTVLPEIGQI